MSYNVGIKNRFAELDSDVEHAPAQHVPEKVEAVVKAPVTAAPKTQERPARNGTRAPRAENQRRPRNEERPARTEGRPERPPRKERLPKAENTESAEGETTEAVEDAKPTHNNRRGRARPAPRTGRHDGFDRHSANFNQKLKKGGAGAHNWGKDGENVEKAESPVAENEETPVVTEEAATAEVEQTEAAKAPEAEKVYTFTDYVKDMEVKRANLPKKTGIASSTEITDSIENGKYKIHVKTRDEKEKTETESKPLVNNRVNLYEFIQNNGGKIPSGFSEDRRRGSRDNRENNRENNRDNFRRGNRENNARTKPISFDAAAFPAL